MGLIRRIRKKEPAIGEHLAGLFDEIKVASVHRRSKARCKSKYKTTKELKLNIGSGDQLKEGFLNLDYSKAADLRLDLRKKIPLPRASCSLIFSEHFVEHLSYPEGVNSFFKDCFRLLHPGGTISLSVPGTLWPLKEYIENKTAYLEACEEHQWHPPFCTTFMEHINYHFRQRWYGMSYAHFENHRFAYDFETMAKKLKQAGFINITERSYDRALDSAHREIGSLFVQASKPN